MKRESLCMLGAMLFFALASSANASVCYLPDGCSEFDHPEEYVFTSVLMCSQEGGYYKRSEAPAGYNCVSAESECDGMVKCEPTECIKMGYTYVGLKEDEEAWSYESCPKNGTSQNNQLFYKRQPLPCEDGFSITVSADDCTNGFVTSHNSGSNVCGKCLEAPEGEDDICKANGMYAKSYKPETCQACRLIEAEGADYYVECQECEDFSDSYFSRGELARNSCVKNFGNSTELAAGSIVCYEKGSVTYKTAQEAGCHKENYDAVSCSCTGEDDGCPSGYFKEVFGDCPSGSDYGVSSDNNTCVACVYEVCDDGKVSTSSVKLKTASQEDSEKDVKRTYVNENGMVCTQVCAPASKGGLLGSSQACKTECADATAGARRRGGGGKNCVIHSVFEDNSSIVFVR